MCPNPHQHLKVAVIGAGFGGIGMGAQLRSSGIDSFKVFERAGGVGGTWWTNRYPGCACDVPSHLYSFSFAPNPDWTHWFAPRAEIQAYLERVVETFSLDNQLELNTGIESAQWNAARNHWELLDSRGRQWTADVLVSAIGGLSRPALPDIAGVGEFRGRVVHSQQWPSELDLSDQRVAVIGTGASAVQLVPRIAATVRHLDVYQRTPNWILPRPDAAIGPSRRRLYRRFPLLQKVMRGLIWMVSEARVPGLAWSNRLAFAHRALARGHLRRQVTDPDLREMLLPDYAIGCKRVLLSSDYYPALVRDNVSLVTTPIKRIESDAIVDHDDTRRPIDTLILATGFHATAPVPNGLITGRDGIDLAEAWSTGPEAWRGVAVHGFPNLYLLLGPNTALGHNSVIVMIEAQIEFVLRALGHMDRTAQRVLEVRAGAQADYNRWLQHKLAGTVWNAGGCGSWYLHPDTGRNTTLWPGFTWRYRSLVRSFDPDAFVADPGSGGPT